jgi:hypothetical protein
MTTGAGEAAAVPTALVALRPILSLLFVLAIPLLLISSSVRWLTEDRSLYVAGFAKYGVSARTGLSEAQLEQVADAFISYFRGPEGRLAIEAVLNGQPRQLFNEREVLHMEDVQKIVHGFHTLQIASILTVLTVIGVGFALWRQSFANALGWMAVWGAGLTIGLLALVGVLSLLDFQALFVRFHIYLIMLFPLGFWLDATFRLVAMIAAGAVAVGAVGMGLIKSSGPG